MSSDILSNFGCLDELTRVIYQSVYKFVVLSSVSDDCWSIRLALAGDSEGRWWHGTWTQDDILRVVGTKSSDKLQEAFAEKLAEAFVQGELHVGDWNPEKGTKINLTFASSSKKPIHVPLTEMTATDAAAYATTLFLDIAMQAQSRKCRLHPPATQYSLTTSYVAHPSKAQGSGQSMTGANTSSNIQPVVAACNDSPQTKAASENSSEGQKAQAQEIKVLKAQIEKQKKRLTSPPERFIPEPRVKKGASLANPNKKARKYQAIEFESDDE